MGKQKRAKAHHVVPQFYLNAWADSDRRLTMLNRSTGSEVTTGSTVLGQETDFYALTRTDGSKDSRLEQSALRKWDGQGASVHRQLLAGDFPLDATARQGLAMFLALQYLRGRKTRQGMQEIFGFVDDIVKSGVRLEDSGDAGRRASPWPSSAAGPALGGVPSDVSEAFADAATFDPDHSQNQMLHMMVKAVPAVAERLLEAEWLLLDFGDGYPLITSDEPFSMYSERPEVQSGMVGIGPANAEYIQLPLSPNLCLALTRALGVGGDRKLPGDSHMADSINELTVKSWWRQLFRHPDSPAFPEYSPLPETAVRITGWPDADTAV